MVLNDLLAGSREVYIKMSIYKGFDNQPLATSNSNVMSQTINLLSGNITTKSNLDLRYLFDFNNLTGISTNQYYSVLPDGAYRYCFTIYDVITNKQISNTACSLVNIRKFAPPFLNLPTNHNIITEKGGMQNILFQWVKSGGIIPQLRYKFTLKQLFDSSQDVNSAFLMGIPIYETTVNNPTLLYDISKPVLEKGKRYAWQVQATSSLGDVFYNQGKSEVFEFSYVGECKKPYFLTAQIDQFNNTTLRWQAPINSDIDQVYTIQYREKDTENWEEINAYQTNILLADLKPNTHYQYRVGQTCKGMLNLGFSDAKSLAFSAIQEFKTSELNKGDNTTTFQCGVAPQIDLSNRKPYKFLLTKNQVFMAGDFPVTVIQATEQNGKFSGTGYTKVPYLGNIKIKVKFENITLNTDKRMIDGFLETTYDMERTKVAVTLDDGNMNDMAMCDTTTTVSQNQEEEEVVQNETIKENTNTNPTPKKNQETTKTEKPTNNDTSPTPTTNQANDGVIVQNQNKDQKNNNSDPKNNENNNTNTNDTNSGKSEIYVQYLGRKYYNGDVLELKYQLDFPTNIMEIVGIPENKKIDWSNYINKETLQRAWTLGKTVYFNQTILDNLNNDSYIKVEYWDKDKPYKEAKKEALWIRVKLERPHFRIQELYAGDAKQPKRLAKSGETLYLVQNYGTTAIRKKGRKRTVNLSVVSSEKNIKTTDIKWYYYSNSRNKFYEYKNKRGKINTYAKVDQMSFDENQYRKHQFKVSGGYPNSIDKSVNVVYVSGKPTNTKIGISGVSHVVKETLSKVNKGFRLLNKINKKLGLNKKNKFEVQALSVIKREQNKEDEKSRLYKHIEETKLSWSVEAELRECTFTHPVLKTFEKAGIFRAGLYAKLKAGASLEGTQERFKYVESNFYKDKTNKIIISPYGCIEAGLQAKLLVIPQQVKFEAQGFVEGCLKGEINYDFKDEKFKGKIYIPPVIIGAKILAETRGTLKFELIDWEGNIEITKEFPIWPPKEKK